MKNLPLQNLYLKLIISSFLILAGIQAISQQMSSMTFRALIDGSDFVHVKGSQVWYEHRNYQFPGLADGSNEPTYINGNTWFPTWSGDLSDKYSSLNPPLSNTGTFNTTLTNVSSGELDHSGYTTLIQKPTSANGYEAIILLDDDAHLDEDWYSFTLNWGVATPIGCTPPKEVIATDITGTTATIKWQKQDGILGYYWVIWPNPKTGCSGGTIDRRRCKINLSNLTPNTTYHFLVGTICSDQSSTNPIFLDFTTAGPTSGCKDVKVDTKMSLSIKPNPVNRNLIFSYNSSSAGKAELKIIDELGRIRLMKTTVLKKGDSYYDVDLPGFLQGSYFLQVSTASDKQQAAFTIQQ